MRFLGEKPEKIIARSDKSFESVVCQGMMAIPRANATAKAKYNLRLMVLAETGGGSGRLSTLGILHSVQDDSKNSGQR
jgi:hypothetical protein